MAVSELQINARSMTFDALCAGAEGDPLLILLHGLPRNRWEWHHQIAPMAELGFRVVAPDLRGFCAGARPQGVEAYHVDEYAQDVLAIADAVGSAGKPFHLMGTSIGASMAWWLAGRYAERVATLVCINIPHPGALAEQRGAARGEVAVHVAEVRPHGEQADQVADRGRERDEDAHEADNDRAELAAVPSEAHKDRPGRRTEKRGRPKSSAQKKRAAPGCAGAPEQPAAGRPQQQGAVQRPYSRASMRESVVRGEEPLSGK